MTNQLARTIRALALLVSICMLSITAEGQSRPRRVTPAATTQVQETRPRRTRSHTKPPEAAKGTDTFIDRINRLVDEYLQPIRLPKP